MAGIPELSQKLTQLVFMALDHGIWFVRAGRSSRSFIPAWKPDWGCVVSDEDAGARLDEKSPYKQRLHWCTYFGRDRASRLDFAGLEGDPQAVVRRHADGSVEVVLGEYWQSAEKLLEAQRRLEPVFFRTAPGRR